MKAVQFLATLWLIGQVFLTVSCEIFGIGADFQAVEEETVTVTIAVSGRNIGVADIVVRLPDGSEESYPGVAVPWNSSYEAEGFYSVHVVNTETGGSTLISDSVDQWSGNTINDGSVDFISAGVSPGDFLENTSDGEIAVVGEPVTVSQLSLSRNPFAVGYRQYRLLEDTLVGGAATSTSAGELVDGAASFLTTASTGLIVRNTDNDTYARVSSVLSNTILTVNPDIMSSGENYALYELTDEGGFSTNYAGGGLIDSDQDFSSLAGTIDLVYRSDNGNYAHIDSILSSTEVALSQNLFPLHSINYAVYRGRSVEISILKNGTRMGHVEMQGWQDLEPTVSIVVD